MIGLSLFRTVCIIFLSNEFGLSWSSVFVEMIWITMSLVFILLVLLLFVVVLREVFPFKLFLFYFIRHFLSSFSLELTRWFLLTTRLAKLGRGRSTVPVERVVITTKLIESVLVEEFAIRIYKWAILVDVETCIVILASWRIPLIIILFLLQTFVLLILLSWILRSARPNLLNWTAWLWTCCPSVKPRTSWVGMFWIWLASSLF